MNRLQDKSGFGVYRHHRRVLAASLVGTAVEFYDFYIYATAAALVFGPLFFPASNPSVQMLGAYASFAVAFFARPFGAAVFGHFGDRIGRKSTLVASLLLMGASTLLIAFLPTYETAGLLAPLLLCLLRFGQGFGLGGEWGGAALLAVENAPAGYEARFGMFPQLGAPIGFAAANGLFLVLGWLLSDEEFTTWGWRVPFLLSFVLVGLGLWVRLRLVETPAFRAALEAAPPADVPIRDLVRDHLRATLAGTCSVIVCFAIFYVSTVFALGYGTTTLGYPRETFLAVQVGAIAFMAFGILLAGAASDWLSPRAVLTAGCVAAIALGLAVPAAFAAESLVAITAFLIAGLFVTGVTYAPLGAFLPMLFPARVRYTGSSLAMNIGGILGGGLAPVIAHSLVQHGGLFYVGMYISIAGVISLVALACVRKPEPTLADAAYDRARLPSQSVGPERWD
jgi:MFS family permease